MAAARHLVVVGGADADATDALADALRDEFAVRTAYSQADLLASLDDEVDVVLVDTRLPDLSADRLRDRIRTDDLDCQVGVLTAEEAETSTDARARAALADALVTPPSADDDEAWRAAVSRLAARAHYRKRLEEYYDVADEYAKLVVDTRSEDGPDGETAESAAGDEDVAAERERLADHLDRLRDDLEEAYDDLDVESVFDVAMDPWAGSPPPWRDAADPTDDDGVDPADDSGSDTTDDGGS